MGARARTCAPPSTARARPGTPETRAKQVSATLSQPRDKSHGSRSVTGEAKLDSDFRQRDFYQAEFLPEQTLVK